MDITWTGNDNERTEGMVAIKKDTTWKGKENEMTDSTVAR